MLKRFPPMAISKCMQNSRAFTLMELLVTITILGVLAALLVPGIEAVRASADASACARNMRSVGQGILLYASDNQGMYPTLADVGDTKSWANSVVSYLGGDSAVEASKHQTALKVMRCPSMRRTIIALKGGGVSESSLSIQALRNFAMNIYLGPSSGDLANWRTVASVKQPSKTMLLSEAGITATGDCIFIMDNYWLGRSTLDAQGRTRPGVHNGANNIVWCDGHLSQWKDVSLLQKAPYRDGGTEDLWTGR